MAKLLERIFPIPIINLWNWADGNEYTIDDENIELPLELQKSDKEIEESYEKHFRKEVKGNSGKGKSKFKEGNKVETKQLNKTVDTKQTVSKEEKTDGEKERDD